MPRDRVLVDGRTAFVSGAASGIGRAVAQRLAGHGCPVAIIDQDEAGLAETADLISGPVLARRIDVRDRHAQFAFAAEVVEWARAPIGMVFNNAGVATSQTVADAAVEDDEWVWPERAAKIIHEGVKAGRSRILVGPDAYLFDALARIAPTRSSDVLARLEKLGSDRR